MTLAPGTRHGSYEIVSALGEGGMGQVYRARDTRLHRDVAIKVLPAHFAADPERLARLGREARLLASLNHPNVAAIYGLEEIEGAPSLVMELVQGETLAERLTRGALPHEDALPIAAQIAAGLEAAHDAGVIHRDLKPANVMVRSDGSVKILDLGLARSVEATAGTTDPSLSPTVTSAPTGTGVILGTAAYMSPEQARGRPLDKRTDLFSFGCVLYECLTGKRAFPGETVSDSLAAILRAEPDWSALPPETSSSIRHLLRRCLEKDPKRRLRDVGDARLELEDAATARPGDVATTAAFPRPRRTSAAVGALAGLVLGAAATFSAGRLFAPPTRLPAPPVRATLPLPANVRLAFMGRPAIAVSPDGRMVIFRAVQDGRQQLFRRRLDDSEAEPIAGTEGGDYPFFSPDGEWVGFFTRSHLKKVPLAGGAPIVISAVPPVTAGAAWGEDGNIVLTLTVNEGLSRISAGGGSPETVSTLDPSRQERSHLWPQILPEGRGILVTMVVGKDFQDFANSQIVVLDPKTKGRTVALEGSPFARYANGQLVFVRGGSLFRVPFDLRRLTVVGSPIPLPEKVTTHSATGAASFALTPDGTFVYAEGPPVADQPSTVYRLDRTGRESALPLPPALYAHPRLSPDGRRLALEKCEDESCKLFVFDLHRNVLSPLTPEPGRAFNPVWSPDGRRIAYTHFAAGAPTLYVKNADGSGQPARLTDAPTATRQTAEFPNSWSPDGRTIAYIAVHSMAEGKPARDIWLASTGGKREWRPWTDDPWVETAAAFSPDGRWMAYVSDESGRQEVYVRPFPGPGGRTKISSDGGAEPVWTRGGREILYRQGDKFLAVEIRTEPELSVGAQQLLFSGDFYRGGREDAPFEYAPTSDGNTIYATRAVASPAPEPERRLAIVTNWLGATSAPEPAK